MLEMKAFQRAAALVLAVNLEIKAPFPRAVALVVVVGVVAVWMVPLVIVLKKIGVAAPAKAAALEMEVGGVWEEVVGVVSEMVVVGVWEEVVGVVSEMVVVGVWEEVVVATSPAHRIDLKKQEKEALVSSPQMRHHPKKGHRPGEVPIPTTPP